MFKNLQYILKTAILYCFILTFYCSILSNASNPGNTEPGVICSGTKLDLVFLLDVGHGRSAHYMMDFVQALFRNADVDENKVRVGLVVYSEIVHAMFHLKDYSKKADMDQVISSFTADDGLVHVFSYPGRNTAEALKTMRSIMFTQENGDRDGVQNVAVILTHGVSNVDASGTIPEAEQAKADGIRIYAVGIGLNYTKEVNAIASSSEGVNSFHVSYYRELDDLKLRVVKALYKKCDVYDDDLDCDTDCLQVCTKSCPKQGFDKLVEECKLTESGQFENKQCVSSEVSKLVSYINNASKEDFNRAINKASDVIIHLVNTTSIAPEVVADQIVDALQKVANKVDFDKTFNVDVSTFDTLMSLTDIVTSSQQTVWQDVTEEGPSTISSLISSLELIAFKGFSENETTKDISIVKSTLGVEIGTVLKNIQYPNLNPSSKLNQTNSSLPEHWMHKNKIFLSEQAFDGINSSVKYSIVVIENKHNVWKVDLLTDTLNESTIQDIVSDVMALSVNVILPTPLKSLVKLTFGVSKLQTSHEKPVCVFLKTSTGGREMWSSQGCSMDNITDDHIVCTCDHLTTFAILASPFKQLHHGVLSSLTIVGCAVSIVCLAVTVFVYLYLWKYIRSERSVLLVNLCVCMMIAYLIFVVGITKTEDTIACKIVAVCLHYCFLTVFFNFLTQGLALYVTVNSMTDKPRLKRYLLLTYMSPLIIILITLAVYRTEGYGTEKYCWLSHERGFIWSFIGPVLAVIFVNGLVLFAVIRIARRNRALNRQACNVKTFSTVRAIVILTPLFGLTWVFGLLSINEDFLVFQFLFVILNSFQGLFIFVIHCLGQRQIREAFQNLMRKKKSAHLDLADNKMSSSLPNTTSN